MNKKLMSVLCLILALTMVFGLTACGAKEPEVEEPVTNEQPVEGEETPERELVDIIIYTHTALGDQPGKQATLDAASAYILEKLNTNVEFNVYATSEFKEVVNTVFSSGAPMDAILVGSTGIDFPTNVARNAFLPLNDYIDEYLPGTKELLPEASWDAYTVDGQIYGFASVKDLSTQLGHWVNQDMLDDLGIEFPVDNYNTSFDLVEFWRAVKAARDAKYPEKADQPLIETAEMCHLPYWFELDSYAGSNFAIANIPGMNTPLSGIAEDGSEVTCLYYTDEFREYAKTIRTLIDERIFSIDGDDDAWMTEALISGEALGSNLWGDVPSASRWPNFNGQMYWENQAIFNTSGLMAAGWALPVQCTNVERTLEVLELMNTDTYLSTIMHFGPEGTGWTDNDNDGVVEFAGTLNDTTNQAERYWYQWYGFALGAFPTSKAPEGVDADFAQTVLDANAAGVPSANIGFAFDASNVQTEIAACSSVYSEYYGILSLGKSPDPDATVDEFVAKLKASGCDTIVAECQAQLDAWRAEQGL